MTLHQQDAPQRRLDEFDKDEWRDVVRRLRPDWTEEDFERAWCGFVQMKHTLGDVAGSA